MDFPVAYAAINQASQVREKSSSGGMFYLLAEHVIRKGGVVFGAGYDENWQIVHGYAEDMNGVETFMGSKYVQSRIGDSFIQAKEFLKQGRLVLFSGTTCQIYGLKAYLGKEYENLITVDVICHGVPSPKIWREYLQLRAKGRKVTGVSFRDKTEGWIVYSMKIDFENGETYRKTQREDLFMRGFLQDIYLRPSCYHCKFRGELRNVDFTLADLWGCRAVAEDMFDGKGTSLVLIHSRKGADIWEAVSAAVDAKLLQTKDYQRFNKSLIASAMKPEKNRKFWKDPSFENLQKLVSQKMGLFEKLRRKARKAVKILLKRA